MRRAISNPIGNAVKYGGGAKAALKAEARHVALSIEDRGPGIPRSEREKVFEPFYRIEGSRNPDTGGSDIVLGTRKGGGLSASSCRLDPDILAAGH